METKKEYPKLIDVTLPQPERREPVDSLNQKLQEFITLSTDKTADGTDYDPSLGKRIEMSIPEKAEFLDSSLREFSRLDLNQREAVLPTLYNLIMLTNKDGNKVIPVIKADVLIHLADKDQTEKLKMAAGLLKDLRFHNTDARLMQLYRGCYEITELNEDGSIKAHVFDRTNGGYAHQSMGGLARFSLIKAVLGHHLLIAEKEIPDWHPKGGSIHDNIAYFEKRVGIKSSDPDLPAIFIGNHGRMGSSGAEATKEFLEYNSGGVLDESKVESEWFQAGEIDAYACERVGVIKEELSMGKKPRVIFTLPEILDQARRN